MSSRERRDARETGADVTGLTALGSPLAIRCSVALELQIEDADGNYAPQSPRLTQLAVVEVLAAGVALRQNPERLARLQRNSENVRGQRARYRIGPAEDTHDAQGNQALRTRR